MHQKAHENHFVIERYNRIEKENFIKRTSDLGLISSHAARLSPGRRHSPIREIIVNRKSLSPRRDSPMRRSPLRSHRERNSLMG